MVAAIPSLPNIGQYMGSIHEPSRLRRSNLAFSFLQSRLVEPCTLPESELL